MATEQKMSKAITLKGSAEIIAKYLRYSVNSILYQRGIFPAETFENVKEYGLPLLMITDAKVIEFLDVVLKHVEAWIAINGVFKVRMLITKVSNKEILEFWDFKVLSEPNQIENEKKQAQICLINEQCSFKDLNKIQREICDVIRQISATVTFLPLLDCLCTFDLQVFLAMHAAVPEAWQITGTSELQNGQIVQLRSFSTGLHKMETFVNYKIGI